MTVTMPERDTIVREIPSEEEKVPAEHQATALGTPDVFCHIITASAETLCGKPLVGAFRHPHRAGPAPWCPNGNPSCPECAQLLEEL